GGRLAGVLVILTTNRFLSLDPAVVSRIPLHVHVPYPPGRQEVGEVVDTIAGEYGYQLSPPVRERLIEAFMGPVVQSSLFNAPLDEDGRSRAAGNLFSPRDIQQAMLLLEGGQAGARRGPYPVTEADVARMEGYYQRFSLSAEAQESIR